MSSASQYSRGIELFRQGMYDQAVSILCEPAGEQGILGRLARYYQAQACRRAGAELAKAGNLAGAQEYLRRTVSLIGPDGDLATYLARLYTQMKLHDRAEAHCEIAVARQDCPAARLALARAQMRMGKTAQAHLTLHEALREFPQSVELRLEAGLLLAREERFVQAAEQLQAALELDCLCDQAHYHLGLVRAAQGDCAEAVRHLQRALLLRPQDLLLAYQLALTARAAAEAGRPVTMRLPEAMPPSEKTCLRQLAEFVANEPDFVMGFLSLPASQVDDELFGLLSAVLETALVDHDDYADLHLRQALVRRRLGDHVGAERHARRAVRINGRYVQAQILLGHLLADHSPTEAITHYRAALRAGGDYADVHAALGKLYARLGQSDKAGRSLRRALEINHDFASAREALNCLAA